MREPLVSDELWSIVRILIPRVRAKPKGGRLRIADRATLTGILFVLRTGIPWEALPLEMGCGSGVTCWRRLRDWQKLGVWRQLHRELLRRLRQADRIDWSRAALDSSSIAAKRGRRDGTEPDRSGPSGHEASPHHGPQRHPPRLSPDRGECP